MISNKYEKKDLSLKDCQRIWHTDKNGFDGEIQNQDGVPYAFRDEGGLLS